MRNGRMMVAWTLVAIVPTVALGDDTAAVMAALKDEASECRYMETLCADTQRAYERFVPYSDAEKQGKNDAYTVKMASEGLKAWEAQLERFGKALDVWRAKRPKKPGCAVEAKCERLRKIGWN